jgi:hypothetical protein
MKKTILWTLMFGTVVLTACGGGGGGGSIVRKDSYQRTEVPYATPVLQVVVDPLINVTNNGDVRAVVDTFAADIAGTGGQDLIIAGRMTQPATVADWGNFRLSFLTWQNNRLVDKTAQWFPNDTNIILGSEPSVKFADFFKTGRNDMFLSTGTDMEHYGPTYFYRNTGTSFERQVLTTAKIWSHDSAIGDLDGDGYTDIAIIDYGPNATLAFNNKVNGFNVYTQNPDKMQLFSGSSVAIGDFMGTGKGQLVVTDTSESLVSRPTKLYSWEIDSDNKLNFTIISTLPTPRFELPKWAGYGFSPGGSHNVRAVTYDFNDDNIPDVLIFSRPGVTPKDAYYSEIQFLKNSGKGNFTDVTDTVLVGYNTHTWACYNPKFLDLNGDGREDILVSGSDYTGANTSTQFLLKSSDGKYVAAYQNIMTDFATQVNTIQGTDNAGNTVNLLKAPNGKLYLVSAVSFLNRGDRQLAVYMSELGSQSVTTAQTAINLILQKWPYMTVPQANAVLAQTSAKYLGGNVIDYDALWTPSGTLSLTTAGGIKPISGYISGVNFDSTESMVTDDLKRSFTVNLGSMHVDRPSAFSQSVGFADQDTLTSQAEYLVNGPVANFGGIRVGSNYSSQLSDTRQLQYTLGIPNYYQKGDFSLGVQYTHLNSNPWINFTGAWGEITGSSILDNVLTYRKDGFSAQASLMYVATSIDPGLVTKVSPMLAAWTEIGYNTDPKSPLGNIGLYAGIKPVTLSGHVSAKIPTSVDMAGNIVYTNKKLTVQDQAIGYARITYTNQLSRHSQFKVSAMGTATGEYKMVNELKLQF